MREVIYSRGMLPIFVWSDKEGEKYVNLAVNGISLVLQTMVDVSRFFPVKRVGSAWSEREFGSAEWYFQQATKRQGPYRLQYRASDILDICGGEPYQLRNPHIEFAVTEKDLYDGDLKFVYGSTRILTPVSFKLIDNRVNVAGVVISARRIKEFYPRDYLEVFSNMVVHEAAHLFNVPDRSYNVEYSLGQHCIRSDCVIGQVNVTRKDERGEVRFIDALEVTRNVSERANVTGSPFCGDCLNDLIRNKKQCVWELFRRIV